jgi:hypothetical protein
VLNHTGVLLPFQAVRQGKRKDRLPAVRALSSRLKSVSMYRHERDLSNLPEIYVQVNVSIRLAGDNIAVAGNLWKYRHAAGQQACSDADCQQSVDK